MPRGKESMNMEGDKCGGRREPSESQKVGLSWASLSSGGFWSLK